MHGQRSAAARVDETGEASTRPPRPNPDRPARCAGTPPQERRGNLTTPALRATPPQERRGNLTTSALRATPPQERRGNLTPPALRATPPQERRGNTTTKSGEPERRFLLGDQLGDPLLRQRKQRGHLRGGEGRAFGGSLDLAETARARHHHVHVGLPIRILGVVQIEDGPAPHAAPRHSGAETPDR